MPLTGVGKGVLNGAAALYVAAGILAVTMVGTTLPTPLYGLYEHRYDFGSLIVTIVFATYAVGVIAALVVSGQWSDQIGRRPMLLVAMVLSALSAVTFLFAGGLAWLFAGRLVSGLSAGAITGTATATVIDLAPRRYRSRAPVVVTTANMGGLGVGPLLAGMLAQYEPAPLRTPYVVDLMLLVLAGVALLALPETAGGGAGRARLHPQPVRVPPEVRGVFVPAAIAGFAGFATLGLFTSISPSFVTVLLGIHSRALAGVVVFIVFAASAAGQVATVRMSPRAALPIGCGVLIAGMGLIAAALMFRSLAALIAGAVVTGAGQGTGFRAAVASVSRSSPPRRRGEVTSALFVALYVGISIPVIGMGAGVRTLGLRVSGMIFAGFVAVLAAVAAIRVTRTGRRCDG